ncbi:MAG TPA: hypothetical protein VMV69_23135 [Pirellulales bacterium]|nr:hypothetical protein [Pirellulales bacterium]
MSYSQEEVETRAAQYAMLRGLSLERRLGYGVHGMVWATDHKSAVKAHAQDSRHSAV